MVDFCTIDRSNPARPRASDSCSREARETLDAPGFRSLPREEQSALVRALSRHDGDSGFAEAVHDLVSSPDFASLDAAERAEMARQVAEHPTAETARRLVHLSRDEAFRSLPVAVTVPEIRETGTARAPGVADLVRDADLQPPPRSRPRLVTMLTEAGFELGEIAGAEHLIDGATLLRTGLPLAGEPVVAGAASLVVPLLAAYEVAEGLGVSVEDGHEWGRRVAYGGGLSTGIARHLADQPSHEIPSAIAFNRDARTEFERGLRQADTAWEQLGPSGRAALLANPADLAAEVDAFVIRRTIDGR